MCLVKNSHNNTIVKIAPLAALIVMVQTSALADTTISTATTTPLTLGSGNLTITSSGSITCSGDTVFATATLGTINNAGTLDSSLHAIHLGPSTQAIINSGTINAEEIGIYNAGGTLGSLTNTGRITATRDSANSSYAGISNLGTISTFNNRGTITGTYGVRNTGTITSFTNNGTITGSSYALYNGSSATLGTINNSGSLQGNITNLSSSNLIINGGSNGTTGTLTGYNGGIGIISNSNSNVVLGSGNILLNDNVSLGSWALNNTAAALYVSQPITISGNYNQSSAASLNINVSGGAITTGDIATDSGYGRLLVSGAANIASGSSINLVNQGYSFASGQRYVVIRASSTGTNYNESTLNYTASGFSGMVSGSDVVSGNNADLVVSLGGVGGSTYATQGNAISSLSGLQRYSGVSAPALLNLYNASLAINTTAEANRTGEQLSASASLTAARASTATTVEVFNVIGNHVTELRLAQHNGGGLSSGDAVSQYRAWGQVLGGHIKQGTVDNVSGYKANYSGLVLGADREIDRWRLGGAFSYNTTDVNNTDNLSNDSARINAYGLTGYASYSASNWYSNLYATVVKQDYNTQRAVNFTGYHGVASGSFGGQQVALRAELGYPIALPNEITLTPLAGATYSYLEQSGYTENGGNGSALKVDASHSNSIRSSIGARLEKVLSTDIGKVVPYAQLVWTHQYTQQRMTTTAAFAADTSGQTAFTTQGSSPISDTADLALGAMLLGSDTRSLIARYDLQAGQQYTNQALSLRFQQLF